MSILAKLHATLPSPVFPRFYVPALDPHQPDVVLPADEARHLGRVLRLGPGARVSVFDGRGGEWAAEVASASRDHATLRRLQPLTPAPETRMPVTLVMSVLKGEKMDEVVRDAVMLGVAAIVPMVTARSETSLAALTRGARAERWRRIAVASAKQCGRAVVPEIAEPATFDAVMTTSVDAVRLMLAEPNAHAARVVSLRDVPVSPAHLLIGPEGGWTDEELARTDAAGAVVVRLGGRTLRADAVPLIALTALLSGWGEL